MNYVPRAFVEKTKTKKFRYGHLFPAIQSLTSAFELPVKRALSYGCASGEECLTLAELYPEAEIHGTDVLPEMVEAATTTCAGEPRIKIVPYSEFWGSEVQTYDLVTCMSVLLSYSPLLSPSTPDANDDEKRKRHQEYLSTSVKEKFPFSEFDEVVRHIDRRVRSGGLLVLLNANYRLADTDVGQGYRSVIMPGVNLETIPKADTTHQLIEHEYTEVVFRKMPQRDHLIS